MGNLRSTPRKAITRRPPTTYSIIRPLAWEHTFAVGNVAMSRRNILTSCVDSVLVRLAIILNPTVVPLFPRKVPSIDAVIKVRTTYNSIGLTRKLQIKQEINVTAAPSIKTVYIKPTQGW